MPNYKKGFTLAEILITLLIIGVVSSIVIPPIIINTQDAELKSAWVKKYSELDQITRFVLLDNAGHLKNICSGDYSCFTSYLKNYLSYTKFCSNAATQGCWHLANEWHFLNHTPGTVLDNSAANGRTIDYDGMILNDGSLLFSVWMSSTCTWTQFPQACGHITVDTNGFKGPNTLGKDILAVYVTDTGIKPVGSDGTHYAVHRSCIDSINGYGCSADYLKQ